MLLSLLPDLILCRSTAQPTLYSDICLRKGNASSHYVVTAVFGALTCNNAVAVNQHSLLFGAVVYFLEQHLMELCLDWQESQEKGMAPFNISSVYVD